MNKQSHKISLITLLYALGASLWILLSDLLIGFFIKDASALVIASTTKGWVFVGVTALLLYRLLLSMHVARPAGDAQEKGAAKSSSRILSWGVAAVIAMIMLAGVVAIRDLVVRHEVHNTARL